MRKLAWSLMLMVGCGGMFLDPYAMPDAFEQQLTAAREEAQDHHTSLMSAVRLDAVRAEVEHHLDEAYRVAVHMRRTIDLRACLSPSARDAMHALVTTWVMAEAAHGIALLDAASMDDVWAECLAHRTTVAALLAGLEDRWAAMRC